MGAALAYTAAVVATWVQQPTSRQVGDVVIRETQTTTGLELVPPALVVGLVALVCGVGVLATRGLPRRIIALLLAVSGGAAVVAAGAGLMRALALDGGLTVAAWAAGPAALLVTVAGVLALSPSAQRMPARYDVDATPEDREWQVATDPSDARRFDDPAG